MPLKHHSVFNARFLFPVLALFLLTALFAQATAVHATTFNLTCFDIYKMADVLDDVNSNNADDVINLSAGCSEFLASYTLNIEADNGHSLIINGNGATLARNLAGGGHRVLTVSSGANVTINALTISRGVGESGAGIYNDGTLTLNHSTVTNNYTGYANIGGGIYNNGTLTVNYSAISSNHAVYGGGGIYNSSSGTTTLNSSTLYNNQSSGGANGGGGIFNQGGTVTLNNTTVTNNTAAFDGGGIYSGGILTLNNTIVANSERGDCRAGGTVTVSYSLIEDGWCVTDGVNGNKTGDPSLGALTVAPNGTSYYPLNPDSIAINAGSNALVPAELTSDQTGNNRILDGTVDMGAHEVAPHVRITPLNTFVAEGTISSFTVTRPGSMTDSLVVSLNITHSPDLTEADYTLSGGSITGQSGLVTVTIPAGESSVLVSVSTVDDIAAEAAETLTITTVEGAGYDIDPVWAVSNLTINANDLVVTNLNDSGEGSLRQAVENAYAFYSNDTITFTVDGTIVLTSGQIPLRFNFSNDTLTIEGDGITISGNNASRIFQVNASARVTLNNLTLINGNATDGPGGAIRNQGMLEINRSTIRDSHSISDGGGIYNEGTLTLNNTTVAGNTSDDDGGGLYNMTGTAALNSSTVANNAATSSGDGITNSATLTLNNTILADNEGMDCSRSGGTVNASHSILESGSDCINGTNANNLTADPMLGSLTLGANGTSYYPLNPDSIAINAGDNALIPVGVTTDQAGNPRIIDGIVDMGAFEYTPVANLAVQLTLQGRLAAPDPSWVSTVHVEVRPAAGGAPVISGDYTADDQGQFQINLLPPGSYNLWIKGTHTLARVHAVTLTAGANNLTTDLLLEGDANDDNQVLLVDFSLLAASFSTADGEPGFEPRADFNQDKEISLLDFSLLSLNYAQTGAP